MVRSFQDLTGLQFGRLTVLERAAVTPKSGKPSLWLCKCKCGAMRQVLRPNLLSGKTVSCGCYAREAATRHGYTRPRTPEYRAWDAIKERCCNPLHRFYSHYGARGILICDRWRDDFTAFLGDVGRRPSPEHSIDRIDNNCGYEPGNVRWATTTEQGRNRRNNRVIEAFGLRLCLSEWAERYGLRSDTIARRLELGWESAMAVSAPVRARKGGAP